MKTRAVQNKPVRNALILGGYGLAGRAIAASLADRIQGSVVIAGRSPDKAEAAVRQVQKNAPDDVSISALAVDINDPGSLWEAAFNRDVIIVCLPLDRSATQSLVDVCVGSQTDCVDISAGTAKYAVLEANRDRIVAAGRRFVIDAGADPGLPGWVARYAAALIAAPKRLTIYARYRARSFGRSGVQDILGQLAETPYAYDGEWRKAGWWTTRVCHFPGGFGKAVALPFYLEELDAVPVETGVEELRLFHAGINPVTDALSLAWMGGVGKVLSIDRAARWFDAAAARFTPQPMGIALRAQLDGHDVSATLDLWHYDLYQATVDIAVLATLNLAEGLSNPGVRFLWQHVDHETFANQLKDSGFSLRTHQIRQ